MTECSRKSWETQAGSAFEGFYGGPATSPPIALRNSVWPGTSFVRPDPESKASLRSPLSRPNSSSNTLYYII